MKIGIVTTWFERGAAYVSKQFKNTLIKDNSVFIYARGGEIYAEGNPEWDDISVTWGKKTTIPTSTAIDLKHFEEWIFDNKLEIVFFNEQHWWEAVLFCNRLGVKTGSYVDFYTEETIPFFGCYDFLICNTKRHYSTFTWHPQAYYIRWGTDVELFKPSTFEIPSSKGITFFHSAGYSPDRKGTDFVIKAFQKVLGDARLVIHSQQDIKRFFPDLKPILDKLLSEGRLDYYEKTVTAPGLYHLGDVYVYPSRLDGIGLTIAEALACGLPVITSDNAPMNEFIVEENGKLVKLTKLYTRKDGYYWPLCEVDVDDLADKMQFYVDNIKDISVYKRNVRNYAEKSLNWEINSESLKYIFQNAIIRNDELKTSAQELASVFEQARTPVQKPLPIVYQIADVLSHLKRKIMK